MTATERIKHVKQEIKRLRAEVWANRTGEDKRNGIGWVCLDYPKMNRIEELREELETLQRQGA